MVLLNQIKKYLENRKLSSNPLVAELQRALSRDRVLEDEVDRITHSTDESIFEGGTAGPVGCCALARKVVSLWCQVHYV